MTPEERVRWKSLLGIMPREEFELVMAARDEWKREAYEDAARIAENCEVTLDGDDPFGNLQIAAAIRARALEEG
jgi:hypothetical protein